MRNLYASQKEKWTRIDDAVPREVHVNGIEKNMRKLPKLNPRVRATV
jgi:hypothetical protein